VHESNKKKGLGEWAELEEKFRRENTTDRCNKELSSQGKGGAGERKTGPQ